MRSLNVLAVACLGAVSLGCADTTAPSSSIRPQYAGGKPGISVTAVQPNYGAPAQTLDVVISGSGFANGATVQWMLKGVPTPKVNVRNVVFVGSTQLKATIDIAADADTVLYDVAVTNTDRKQGIGTEIFQVTKNRPLQDVAVTTTVADADPSVAPSLQLRTDGKGAYLNSRDVGSRIAANGEALLDLYPWQVKKPTRAVYLDFSQPIAGTGPTGSAPVLIPSGYYNARVMVRCNIAGKNPQNMVLGETTSCPFHVGYILFGGEQYVVHMNNLDAGAIDPITDHADVTCTAGTTTCTGWHVVSTGNHVATFKKIITTSTGDTQWLDQGAIRFAFSFDLIRP